MGNGVPLNLNLAQLNPADIDKIIGAKNDLRARYRAIDPNHDLDTFKGSGNPQPAGQGFVFATWQTPPGYPVGTTIDVLLHAIIAHEPAIPIFPPMPLFTSPYPYPGASAKYYDFCHCKRRPAITHYVGSEYPLPIVPTFNPLAFPNILARSPAVANWYTPGNSEFATKMTIQYRDPTTALNADIIGGASDIAVGGVPNDMFEGLQNLSSGTLPGRYRGNQHGWVDITHKVRVPSTTGWKLEIDDTDPDGQSLVFRYPISADQTSLYIPDWIKIEFGARGVHWPVETHSISSYLHSALPTSLTPWKFDVRVLAPTRTFWEKATILHAFSNYAEGKKVPQRQSRHYYDLYCLLNSNIRQRALKDKHLLADVCDHKSVYFRQGWANYNEAKSGRLKLVPPGHVLQQVVADYEKMAEMLFDDAPAWSNVVSELSKFEKELMNQ